MFSPYILAVAKDSNVGKVVLDKIHIDSMKFLLLISFLYAATPPIIFVHLGEKIPPCMVTTMRQARYMNPESHVYLLTDQPLQCDEVEVIRVEPVSIAERYGLDPSVADGLWAHATNRFFVLERFVRERGLRDVIHLENDTMLYVELEEILPQLAEFRLAVPFQSKVGAIPCFVYIRDGEVLTELVEHMRRKLESYRGELAMFRINDMQTVASFDGVAALPTLMKEYKFRARKSRFTADNQTPLHFLMTNGEKFEGYLFDAAGLGIWMNGNNQEYSPGKGAGTIHSRCLFDPSRFEYIWGEDKKGRKVPFLRFNEKEWRIVNLHFHSKKPEDYASF
jgi:hypothetical protein